MGLNIGVRVKKQREEYMSYGYNPKGTSGQIEAEFDAFLREKFPTEVFNPSVTFDEQKQEYDFDIYMHYRDSFHLYLAIFEYVLEHFSVDYGIEMYVYHSP